SWAGSRGIGLLGTSPIILVDKNTIIFGHSPATGASDVAGRARLARAGCASREPPRRARPMPRHAGWAAPWGGRHRPRVAWSGCAGGTAGPPGPFFATASTEPLTYAISTAMVGSAWKGPDPCDRIGRARSKEQPGR